MAEENGGRRLDRVENRLDRIEAALERLVDLHDSDFKKLMTWQVLMQDKMDKYWDYIQAEQQMRRAADKLLDERVDRLVSAIGDLTRKLPEPKADRP